ncbi:MAG: class I SAM-dependent methyltransferase [Planctomycetota bacterium]|nr:class I SAM-dependent methyltransferase [Planctomycetota bacterium]
MAQRSYGQQREMEDPSMVGTLHAQIEMIWPLEQPALERIGIARAERIADLGCGTAEFAGRVAEAYPHIAVHGVDLYEGHIERARQTWTPERVPNLTLEVGDAGKLSWTSQRCDFVAMRHFLHALPEPEVMIKEGRRILKPGGTMYVLAEDYQGLLFDAQAEASRQMFNRVQPAALDKGTDLHHGRTAYRALVRAGFEDVRVDPLVIDTCNTSRDVFARMLRYWRDGYTRFIASSLDEDPRRVKARFDDLILNVMDTERYSCWLIFAVSGKRPRA